MKIHHVVGPLTLVLFANTASGQWKLRPNITIKLNSGFGLTSKAPDFAPEVGILFSF